MEQPTIEADVLARFWAKVNKNGPIHSKLKTPCWLWTASTRHKGYGAFAYTDVHGKAVNARAHRMSWELHKGLVPDGLFVLHKCDTPACLNPHHLFLGTKAENNADMVRKGRHVPGGTHCGAAGKWCRGPSHEETGAKRGADHHNVKLSPEAVTEIRAMSEAGLSYSQIAFKFSIGVTTVFKVVKRQTWAHVK